MFFVHGGLGGVADSDGEIERGTREGNIKHDYHFLLMLFNLFLLLHDKILDIIRIINVMQNFMRIG